MKPSRISNLLSLPLLAICLLATSPLTAMAVTPPAGARVSLNGNVTPGLDRADRIAPLDTSLQLAFEVALAPRDRAGLERFAAAVSDPHSPLHGQYLTPATFADRFGPTPATVSALTDYLGSQGVHVKSVEPDRLIVHAGGPAVAIERAMGVHLYAWHDSQQNRDFFANDAEPALPASLAPSIAAVLGLDNHYRQHHHAVAAAAAQQLAAGTGPGGGFAPKDLLSAYHIDPALGSGAGQTIGLYELDVFKLQNITTYEDYYGLYHAKLTPVGVNGFDTNRAPGNGQIEVELDIEIANAIAPWAAVTIWEGNNGDDRQTGPDDGLRVYSAMVNSNTTRSNSTSWGFCESQTAPSFKNAVHALLLQAAAQGQSFFAASGDNGPYDCPPMTTASGKDVDYPASDPAMTGVGGTSLLTNPANQAYVSESAWGDPNATGTVFGSGGGLSTYFDRPYYQAGPGVDQSGTSNGKRQVPDVASDADPHTGYSVYSQGRWMTVGGTSAGSPMWAGFTALYDNWAAAHGNPALGFANPSLYWLAANPQPYPPFHDVITGPPAPFYPATPGWDFATGLGSYDAYNIVRDLPQPYPPPAPSAVPGNGSATISWSAPAGVPAAGPVHRYTVTASPGGQVATLSPNATSVTMYGLDPGPYSFFVSAVYAGGTGTASSNAVSVPPFLAAPRQGTPWDGGSDAIGIPQGALDAYFAEGTTQAGFEEYLTIQSTAGQQVYIDYLFVDGSVFRKFYNLAANSRSTVWVNQDVGPGRDVSVHIHGSAPFVAERPMYFNFGGWTGGDVAVGSPTLGQFFLFAEGSTQPGFREYLTLLNPGDTGTTVTITYFTPTGALAPVKHGVAPFSRITIDVNAEVGANLDVAVKVTSDLPILVERPIYFSFNGWTGGHVVVGAREPATTANLAEGFVRGGAFREFLTILNPGPDTPVRLSFLLTGGGVVSKTIGIPGGTRQTVDVGAILPDNTSSSVHVQSDFPIVVERPMYFSWNGIDGGHDAVGIPDSALGPAAVLAEGFTGGSFHEYLTVLNNTGTTANATVTYYVTDLATHSNSVLKRLYPLLMRSRTTIDVNNDVGANKSVSVRVDTGPDLPGSGPAIPIVVERPLYFAY